MILRLVCALALVPTCLTGCSTTWVDAKYQQPANFSTWVNAAPAQYLIQPGDDVAITLPLNSELNQNGLVAPDGTFTMTLAGVLPAAGRTTTQFADIIDKALAANDVVANAHASVRVAKYGGHVYVDGQVGKPGAVPLSADMTVIQAIAAASGMKDTARSDEVVLIRRSPVDGRPMLRTIDIDALTHTGDPNQAVVLQASDTIFVPKSSIAEVDQWVDQHLNQAVPFSKSVGYSYNVNPTH
ncbi:polysaccharide biosynthesis/export family protein [Bordetella sp. FB-8]|uniref:polysaccharide biosynthesis/export family protein n=1 Tax=Bordetella sp. FB-8 TaxID=1159870 RepID=UPI0003811D09|nr:polysaccharide biosynthesis/export family protein [Bordetella sp. FB-8]